MLTHITLNMELVDTEALELLFPSQKLSSSVPTILILDSLDESLLLNESEIPVMPRPNYSIKSPKCSKTQIPDKMAPEEITAIVENLRVEMIALKSLDVDRICIMQKSKDQIDFLQSEIRSKMLS